MDSGRVSVGIVGGYPPPIGGVTMHVQRLCRQLQQRELDYQVYHSGRHESERVTSIQGWRFAKLLSALLGRRHSAVLLISRRRMLWAICVLLGTTFGKRVLIRLQGSDLVRLRSTGGWRWWCASAILRRASGVVAVNQDLLDASLAAGVDSANILLMPGFLPPAAEEFDESDVPESVLHFQNERNPVLVGCGIFARHKNEDLYGFDLMIEAVGRLKDDYPDIGLVIAIPQSDGRSAEAEALRSQIKQWKVTESVLLAFRPGYLVPLLTRADLFLRPTNTEGDANSVREALSVDVAVIASDVAPRPEPCVLFANRDAEGLAVQIRNQLQDGQDSKPKQFNDQISWNIARYLGFVLACEFTEKGNRADLLAGSAGR